MKTELIQELFSKSCWDKQAEVNIEDFISVEKFAELIVQTCLTQIALIGISNFENDEHSDISWTVDTSIEMIKEHFGLQ